MRKKEKQTEYGITVAARDAMRELPVRADVFMTAGVYFLGVLSLCLAFRRFRCSALPQSFTPA
jgi:hypothetical protein